MAIRTAEPDRRVAWPDRDVVKAAKVDRECVLVAGLDVGMAREVGLVEAVDGTSRQRRRRVGRRRGLGRRGSYLGRHGGCLGDDRIDRVGEVGRAAGRLRHAIIASAQRAAIGSAGR